MEWQFHDYQLVGVFDQITPDLSAQVAQFWISNAAIADEATCLARAKELVVVAQNSSGAIAGVSPAFATPDPTRPGQFAYAYRTFIRPTDTVVGLFVAIFNASRDVLKQTRASANTASGTPGSNRPERIVFILENPKFGGAAAKRIFRRNSCSFAGRDPRGLEIWQAVD